MSYNIREHAILVRVSISMLGTQKKDKEATEASADRYDAAVDQVSLTKSIINRKNPLFQKVDTIKGLIRNTFLAQTGVWDDNYRVISTKKYGQLRSVIEDLKVDFDQAVDDLVSDMPALRDEARKNLGRLFDDSLIPDDASVRESFGVTFDTEVLPDRANVVMSLEQDRIDQILAEASATDQRRIKALAEETHLRVREELENMIAALREFGDPLKDSKRTRTFRDSLVKRMAKIADVLPGLNITGDPRLEKLAQDISEKLAATDASALRGGKKKRGDNRSQEMIDADAANKREETAAVAEALVEDLAGIFGEAA